MLLRNIKFPPVMGASGVQGFFGDPNHPEYIHSKNIKRVWGNIFENMGFVAKTATLHWNKGNVRLSEKDGYSYTELNPKAIYVMFWKEAALNAVGLSNPGLEFLLKTRIWQKRTEPFMLSFMPIGATPEERLIEAQLATQILLFYKKSIGVDFALQYNLSCPNTDHDQKTLVGEAHAHFDILSYLNIPLVPKINATLDPAIAHTILEHPHVDALCISNTIPFGELPEQIDWKKYSAKNGKSPLEERGFKPGGLSGAPVFPVVMNWLKEFTKISKDTKPIIAGGGIMSWADVYELSTIKRVESISLGSVAFLRPWRVRGIIKEAYKVFEDNFE